MTLVLLASAAAGQLALTVTPSSQTVAEGHRAATDVVLTAQPDEDVTIRMYRSSSKLSAPRPLSFTFTRSNWSTPRTVRWKALSDADANDEDVRLTFFVAEDPAVFTSASVHVVDDEGLPAAERLALHVTPSSQAVAEGRRAATDVVLTAQPDEDVTIRMYRSSSKLSAPRPLSFTFTTSNWSTPRTVRWKALSDADANDEEVKLTFFVAGDPDVFTSASVHVVDAEGLAANQIRLCDTRLGSLEPARAEEELDVCWETGREIPPNRDVVIEMRRKWSWDDPRTSFSPWQAVGTGDWYTRCGAYGTCARFTASGLWRGSAMTFQMRLRRGGRVLVLSPELQVQAPNSDSAELRARLEVVDSPNPELGHFRMELRFSDPLVDSLAAELVQGLEASDFEVSNGRVVDVRYWDSDTYQVVVEPEVLGEPVTVALPADSVLGVGEGVSAEGRNNYTRGNERSNAIAQQTTAPD